MARAKRMLIWILLAIFVMVLAHFIQTLMTNEPMEQLYDTVVSLLVFRVLALAAAVFSTMVISQEVEQKTIVYLLARPIPRISLLIGRAMAAGLVTFSIATFVLVLCAVGVFGINNLPMSEIATDIWAIFCGTVAYGGLFVFFSLIANRAMIYCLLFAFGLETFAANMPGDLSFLSPLAYLNAISQNTAATGDALGVLSGTLEATIISPAVASIICLAWGALFFVVASVWFKVFEYVPREDAE